MATMKQAIEQHQSEGQAIEKLKEVSHNAKTRADDRNWRTSRLS
jgi:hypothetical protein